MSVEANDNQLNKGVMGSIGSAVMGIGCTAPAFSVAVTSAAIIGDVGPLAVGSVIYCGLITFGLVFAFSNLYDFRPTAGASYAWVTEILSPFLGFMAGWSMLLASVIFMVAATIPAASSTLLLFAPDLVGDTSATAMTAVGWLTMITAIVIRGVENAFTAQLLMTFLELIIVMALVVAALFYFGSQPAHQPTLAWISPFSFSFASFSSGAIIALFFYWGWDVTMALGEETKEGEAGRGAFLAVFNLMLFYSIMLCIVLISLSSNEISGSNSNVLFSVANKLFPAPWSYIGVLCVMLSTIGTIEGQIIQFSRCVFAMARDNVIPSGFSSIHKTWRTPWVATLTIWGLGTLLVISSSYMPSVEEVLKSAVSAIGIQICFYMGLAGLASIWHYRKMLNSGIKGAVTHIIWPAAGVLGMIAIGISSIPQLSTISTVIALGGLGLGAVAYQLVKVFVPK